MLFSNSKEKNIKNEFLKNVNFFEHNEKEEI
jgi:hypothetical protein